MSMRVDELYRFDLILFLTKLQYVFQTNHVNTTSKCKNVTMSLQDGWRNYTKKNQHKFRYIHSRVHIAACLSVYCVQKRNELWPLNSLNAFLLCIFFSFCFMLFNSNSNKKWVECPTNAVGWFSSLCYSCYLYLMLLVRFMSTRNIFI